MEHVHGGHPARERPQDRRAPVVDDVGDTDFGRDRAGGLVAASGDGDMDVSVHDAGHDVHAGGVDLAGAGGDVDVGVGAHGIDTAVFNNDSARVDGAVGHGEDRGVADGGERGLRPKGPSGSAPLPRGA